MAGLDLHGEVDMVRRRRDLNARDPLARLRQVPLFTTGVLTLLYCLQAEPGQLDCCTLELVIARLVNSRLQRDQFLRRDTGIVASIELFYKHAGLVSFLQRVGVGKVRQLGVPQVVRANGAPRLLEALVRTDRCNQIASTVSRAEQQKTRDE